MTLGFPINDSFRCGVYPTSEGLNLTFTKMGAGGPEYAMDFRYSPEQANRLILEIQTALARGGHK